MKILSLDQALNVSGYAFFEDGVLKDYGTFTIKKTLPIEIRLAQVQENILDIIYELCGDDKPDKIIFEGIQNQQNNVTYERLAYVQAAIMLLCYHQNIPFEIYRPTEWRKKLGGGFGKKREEQKEAAIKYVKNHYNIDVDSDTADAICIGAAHLVSPENDKKNSAF